MAYTMCFHLSACNQRTIFQSNDAVGSKDSIRDRAWPQPLDKCGTIDDWGAVTRSTHLSRGDTKLARRTEQMYSAGFAVGCEVKFFLEYDINTGW
jgi:hypothetical protein